MAPNSAAGSFRKLSGLSWALSRASTRARRAASPPTAWSKNAARSAGGFSMAARKIDLTLFGSAISRIFPCGCMHFSMLCDVVADLSHEIERTA